MYKIIGADQQEYGPISADQIRQWVSEGRANGQTKVCAEGSQEWKPLSEFPELASITSSPAIAPGVLPAKPPAAIKVFGILNIIFGSLGVLCSPISLILIPMSSKQLGYTAFMTNWLIFSLVAGMIGSAILLASGIGLCKMKEWARKLAVYYSVYACLMPILGTAITLTHPAQNVGPNPEFQKTMQLVGPIAGLVIAWTYYGLMLYFLNQQSVKEALAEKTQRV